MKTETRHIIEFQNGLYDGDAVSGKPHGKGLLTYNDMSIYHGEWKNGKKHGQGLMTVLDKKQTSEDEWITYEGEFTNNEDLVSHLD